MAQTVQIAVIGAGLIGPRHAQSVVSYSQTTLASFVDPSPQAVAVAQAFDVPLYRSLQELLGSDNVPDAAIVCTPNDTHVSISEALLQAGVHVLVEKPIAIDSISGRRLARAASRSQKRVLVGHHRRFNPYVVAAKRVLESEIIGTPIAVSGLWTIGKPASYFQAPTEWRASANGGVLLINLIHEIDVLHYLLGPIVRVHAEQTISQRGHEAEEGAAVLLRFRSGAVGTFVLSDSTPSQHNFESGTGENPIIPKSGKDFYRIFGSEGTLSVGDMKVTKHRQGDDKSWSHPLVEEIIAVGTDVPFDEQIKHFVRVVREDEMPRCSIEDGVRAVEVVEALKEAMKTGQPIDIDRTSRL